MRSHFTSRTARVAARWCGTHGLVTILVRMAATSTAHAQRATKTSSLTPRIAFVDVQQLFDSVPGSSAVAADFADEVRLADVRRLSAEPCLGQ